MKSLIIRTLIACFVIAAFFTGCKKDSQSLDFQRSIFSLDTSEVKQVYHKAQEELVKALGGSYERIAPAWSGSVTNYLTPANIAMYTPIGYNSKTGKLLQLLSLKDKGQLKALLIESEPETTVDNYLSTYDRHKHLTGKLSFYTVTGKFIQGFKMKDGKSIGAFLPTSALENVNVLTHSNNKITDGGVQPQGADPCEGSWGNFGCQELGGVVVSVNVGSQPSPSFVYVSIPNNLYYSSPTGGTVGGGGSYSGYPWLPLPPPSSPSMLDLAGDGGIGIMEACPNSFQFIRLTNTMRQAKTFGLYYRYVTTSGTFYLTFGFKIDMPSDLVYGASSVYSSLTSQFGNKLTTDDLKLYTGTDGQYHLYISPAAQALITAAAMTTCIAQAKLEGLIPLIGTNSTRFKTIYKENLLSNLSSYLTGCRATVLNVNEAGTVPFTSSPLGLLCR